MSAPASTFGVRSAAAAVAQSVLVAACALMQAPPAHAQDGLEFAVKAAFLVRFGPFVEWPASAFAGPAAPLTLCVAGDDPFGVALDKVAAGQKVHDRPIAVRRVKTATRESGCHILYLGSVEPQRPGQAPDSLRGAPVLTVTDAARASGVRGIVHFLVRDERVRFEIDDEAAAQGGLSISSKLLGVALRVNPRSR